MFDMRSSLSLLLLCSTLSQAAHNLCDPVTDPTKYRCCSAQLGSLEPDGAYGFLGVRSTYYGLYLPTTYNPLNWGSGAEIQSHHCLISKDVYKDVAVGPLLDVVRLPPTTRSACQPK